MYREIDEDGLKLDIWLSKKREKKEEYDFIKRLVKKFDEKKVVVKDKEKYIKSEFKKIKE